MKSLSAFARRLSVIVSVVLLIIGTFVLSTAPAMAASHTVVMGGTKGLVFEPASLAVKAGDTVNFEVGQLPPHNIIFDKVPGNDNALAASLSQKSLKGAGSTVAVNIPADAPAGEYSYFCMPHRGAGMVGKIIVQ